MKLPKIIGIAIACVVVITAFSLIHNKMIPEWVLPLSWLPATWIGFGGAVLADRVIQTEAT